MIKIHKLEQLQDVNLADFFKLQKDFRKLFAKANFLVSSSTERYLHEKRL